MLRAGGDDEAVWRLRKHLHQPAHQVDVRTAERAERQVDQSLPAGVTGTVEVAVTTNSGTSGRFPPFTQLVCQ
jgi:hypothetical protein